MMSLVNRSVAKASRMMEAALARGMDQPNAWNATSVEWVRAAKVISNIYVIFSSKNHVTFRHTVISQCYRCSLMLYKCMICAPTINAYLKLSVTCLPYMA